MEIQNSTLANPITERERTAMHSVLMDVLLRVNNLPKDAGLLEVKLLIHRMMGELGG